MSLETPIPANAPSPSGSIVVLEHEPDVLADNPLGDSMCASSVWLPAQYDEGATKGRGRRFPVLYDLVGFTGSGLAHTNWKPFGDNLPERVARLIHERRMGPAIVVFADCFTSLGGNQYINSSAIGAYADYLTREIIPFVDREFRTLASREHRGCFGKSSGGYGAIIHGMKYARHWGAIANHSGDAYFDIVYHHDWPNTLNELAKYREPKRGGPLRTLVESRSRKGSPTVPTRASGASDAVWQKEKLSQSEVHAIMNVCMAASYDPDPKTPLGFRLPFNMETGEMLDARWKRWQQHDPIRLVGKYAAALKTLKGIYVDCGWRDQYHIHYGTRILSLRMAAAGIRHRYEEFDDNHSDVDYRMDVSLPFLYRALKP